MQNIQDNICHVLKKGERQYWLKVEATCGNKSEKVEVVRSKKTQLERKL